MRDSRPLLRVDIYMKLREAILACELRPGADLREQDLATRFAVSKSPVRDALSRLERERLVTVLPRQGYRVAPVSLSDARDMFRFRLVMEAASVVQAARVATDEDLRGLDRFRAFDAGAHPDGFIGYNRAFHCALARLSGNRRMAAAAHDLIEQMDRPVRLSIGMIEGPDISGLVAEHAAIIDALQDRRGKRAAALLRTHIGSAERRVAGALSRAAVLV